MSKVKLHKNRAIQSNNKSGHTGITWCKRSDRWVATIQTEGRLKYLGKFKEEDLAMAVAAREIAEKCYGYGKEHGKEK
jgi:hypothetical protein